MFVVVVTVCRFIPGLSNTRTYQTRLAATEAREAAESVAPDQRSNVADA